MRRRRMVKVGAMGGIAAGIVAEAPRLTAIAVFSRSMYAEGSSGRILCLVREDLEAGPLNVLCGNWPEDAAALIAPGDAFVKEPDGAWAGAAMALDFSGASVWTPPEWPRFDSESAARGLSRLPALAARHAPEGSAAALLVPAGMTAVSPLHAALALKMSAGADALRRWLAKPDDVPDECVRSLLGLGIGLTPSGDDVIAGALLALRAVSRHELADRIAARLREEDGRGANRISQAHLAAAARGKGAAVLHAFLSDLLAGGGHLDALVPRLANVGHTSGWDAIFGMATALKSVVREIA